MSHKCWKFNYSSVELYREKSLGSGSYGSVCRAHCDDLPCAAKILHPIFFQFSDPGAMAIMQRFQQECEFLSAIRHPHIVQYLGTYQDPDSGLPVLLMELMDESLTRFLERSKERLPYHLEVNLCHDIALALAYLHSNGIIHRDLSSNNVLLIAGSRAKVTDFGMAKLITANPRMTPLTQCPGTEVYMSPEALRTPPVYTEKLDCFSCGVLAIQILTRQFPAPGPARNTVEDPRYPTGMIEVPVPEAERRKLHIDVIDPNHPLLSIAVVCLKDDEKLRPTARKLCRSLSQLKGLPEYDHSVEKHPGNQLKHQSSVSLQESTVPVDKKIKELEMEVKAGAKEIHEKDATIAARDQEIKVLKGREPATKEDHRLQAAEREELKHQISDQQKEIHELKEQLQAAFSKTDSNTSENSAKPKSSLISGLSWETLGNAPCNMGKGAVCTNADCSIAYFSSVGSDEIYSYSIMEDKWSMVNPQCPHALFVLVVSGRLLCAIGGLDKGQISDAILTLDTENDLDGKWIQKFPPVPTKRLAPGAVCYNQYIVVAGGKYGLVSGGKVTCVEILNTRSRQWSTAVDIPYAASGMCATVCGDELYIAGGYDETDTKLLAVTSCSLPALIQSCSSSSLQSHFKRIFTRSDDRSSGDSIWQHIADAPLPLSTITTLRGQLVAICKSGREHTLTTTVCVYHSKNDSWQYISKVPTTRTRSLAISLEGDKLIVVGGYIHSESKFCDIVELATILEGASH